MTESQAEKDYRRHETIKKAVIAADRIIMDDFNGNESDTNYLTGNVAIILARKALLPLNLGIVFFTPSNARKKEVIKIAVEEAVNTILKGSFVSEEECNYLMAEVAREFVEKSLRPFGMRMLEKDLKDHYGGEEKNGNPRSFSAADDR